MSFRPLWLIVFAAALLAALSRPVAAGEPQVKLPPGVVIEAQPQDPKQAKIVLVAGSNFFKPGEHDYVAGCAVLADLLRQTPGVFPVLALDWPQKAETFQGAKAVEEKMVWSGAAMGLSPLQRLLRVVLPAALPEVLAGCRTGLVLALSPW